MTGFVEAFVQLLLDIETFYHGFGDPVTVCQLVEVVTRVPEMNKRCGLLANQAGLLRVLQSLETTFGKRIGIAFAGQIQ